MTDPRATVAGVARMLARAELVHAFGHVSQRTDDGGIAITSTRPLLDCTPADVVVLDPDGVPLAGPVDAVPIETPLHRAIYAARDDVGAIARGHPSAAVIWGTGVAELPLLHGLGALCGTRVPVHDDADLIASQASAVAVAGTLGRGHAVLLRGNGALATGGSALEAAARLFFLEDRARVAIGARASVGAGGAVPWDVWEARLRHVEAELSRAIRWFERRFGEEATGTPREAPAPGDDEQEGSGA